jgi:hypothetical protein
MVRIKKTPPKALCQLPPDSSLSCAHQANEIDIFTIFHSLILPDSRRMTKKAGKAGL